MTIKVSSVRAQAIFENLTHLRLRPPRRHKTIILPQYDSKKTKADVERHEKKIDGEQSSLAPQGG